MNILHIAIVYNFQFIIIHFQFGDDIEIENSLIIKSLCALRPLRKTLF